MVSFYNAYLRMLSSFRWSLNRNIIVALALLIIISAVLVLTSSMFVAIRINKDPFYFIKHHFFYLAVSFVILLVVANLSASNLQKFIIAGFIGSFILVWFVFIFGTEIKGAKRWLYLFGFSLQPSEFLKVFFTPFLAIVWNKFEKFKFTAYMSITVIFVISAGSLLVQPDLGMTVLTTLMFGTILFITQVSWVVIWGLAVVAVSLLSGTYFLFPHVANRVSSFFSEQASYQISKATQSIIEGKIFGKGAGMGEVKKYLPDSHTDFIFTVAAEEFGLIFNLFIILIYVSVVITCINVANKTTNTTKKFSLVGLASLLGFQSFIHMASNLNLIPTKGMTLPIISYGGSSLMASMLLFGLLINLTKKNIVYDKNHSS